MTFSSGNDSNRKSRRSGGGSGTSGAEKSSAVNPLTKNAIIRTEMISFDKNSKDLGKGGFGLVRLGQFDGQAVAVKSLFVDSDTVDPLAAAELFLSEAKKMRELEHPRIVKFLGFIMESFSIVMEFMAEGTLDDYLKLHQDLGWRERFTFSLDISDGMEYLHAKLTKDGCVKKDLFHQDLKSANVLLCIEDGRMRGKISDFGLSVIREKTKNESRRINNPQSMAISYVNHVGGTRIYMAPELQQSSRFTKECDVYSYGVVLLELATLSPPHEAVVDFKTKLPLYSIPKIYRNLIFSCLSLDPTKRPSFEIISCFFKENEQEFLKFKPAAKSSTSRHQKLESEWVEEQDVDMEPTIVSKLKRLVKTRKGFIPILVGLVLILLIAAIVVGVLVSTRSASGSAEAVNSSSASSASTISIAASATTTSPYSSPTISWSNLVNWGGVQSDYIYALNTSEQDAIISQLLASNVSVVKVVISQVSAGQAGIQSNAINDVEQSGVGLYDDTILQAIDIFMSKASKFGIKLLIAPHSRYSLGCVSKDSYVYQYNLTAVNPCASVYSSLDNITEFYTNSKIITNYDKRLQYILNHQNSYMGNVPWRTLSSAIYSFDVQHKAQAGNNVDWMCGRAQTIKSALSNSGILVSTSAIGDGASFNQTLISALLNCSNSTFDMLGLDLNVYDNSTINSILKQTTALVANISTTSRSMIKVAVENFCPRQSTRFTDIATLGYNANLLNVSWVLSSLVKGDSSSCGFNTSEPGVWQTISRDGADAMKGSSTFFIPVNYLPQGAVCRNNAQCQVSCCSDQNTNNGANICDITATNC